MQETYAVQYPNFEKNHWWFRARRHILREQLHALAWPPHPTILEIGVGPGENLYSLYPDGAALVGIEPDPALAALARSRGAIPIYEATAEELPESLPDASFDAVTLFDLLEHTKDDLLVLERVRQKLAPGGYLVISVPAFMFLWGQQDVVNLHYRRYTRKEVVSKLQQTGYAVMRATYFNTLLFPPVTTFRILHRILKKPHDKPDTDLKYSLGPLNGLLYHIFRSEKWLLRFMNFPVGTSVLVVARKREDGD